MVKFANGTTYNAIGVYGGEMTHQSARRRTLEILIATDNASFNELSALYGDTAALDSITTVNDENSIDTHLHLHFTLPVSFGLRDFDGEQVWSMKLAEMSALELAQEKQATDIAACEAAIIDIGELLGGE